MGLLYLVTISLFTASYYKLTPLSLPAPPPTSVAAVYGASDSEEESSSEDEHEREIRELQAQVGTLHCLELRAMFIVLSK